MNDTEIIDQLCCLKEFCQAQIQPDANRMWVRDVEALTAAIEQLEQDQWIPIEQGMPTPEEEVFILCYRNGYRFATTAMYEDGTIQEGESRWNWNDIDFDYNEETDENLIPEGWWEYRHCNADDVYNNQVDCKVTHWKPMPKPADE